MTKQERFNRARQQLQEDFSTFLSFETVESKNGIKTNIILGTIILSTGFADYKEVEDTNEVYLDSMLNAIANFDATLVAEDFIDD